MSAQILNARSTRRIERATGLTILRAWGHGGYVFGFVTPDHRHGSYDSRNGEWHFKEQPFHYTSCSELFPGWEPELKDRIMRPAPEEVSPEVTVIVSKTVFGDGWIDPDIIRGIERVTGEEYRDGTWHKPSDS